MERDPMGCDTMYIDTAVPYGMWHHVTWYSGTLWDVTPCDLIGRYLMVCNTMWLGMALRCEM